MIESKHLCKRVTQRTGINKRATKRFVAKAEKYGFKLNEIKTSRKLYGYIHSHILDDDIYDIILYNRCLVLLNKKADVGITLLQLPYKYHKYEDRLKETRRKQEDENSQHTIGDNPSRREEEH